MNDKTIKKNITRLWNQAYINYDDCYAHGLKSEEEKKEWLRFLRKVIGKQPCSILDVGAGTGFVSLLLAELGHTCKGVDLSENMLSKAKEKAEKAGFHNVTFAIGDAEDTKESACTLCRLFTGQTAEDHQFRQGVGAQTVCTVQTNRGTTHSTPGG